MQKGTFTQNIQSQPIYPVNKIHILNT